LQTIFNKIQIYIGDRSPLLENLKEKKVLVEVYVEKGNRESIFQKAGKEN
jgi:hypothetical protein